MSIFFFLRDCGFSQEVASSILKKIDSGPKYHGSYHINRLWEKFIKTRDNFTPEERKIFGLSIIFHDIVYTPGVTGNEINSLGYFLRVSENLYTSTDSIKEPLITETEIYHISQVILQSNPKFYDKIQKGTFPDRFVRLFDLDDLIQADYKVVEENTKRIIEENYRIAEQEIIGHRMYEFLQIFVLPYYDIDNGISVVKKVLENNYKIKFKKD